MKNIAKDFTHYLVLFGVFFVGLLGFVLFSYDRNFQTVIAIFVAISYVIWGIVHHAIHKDLYLSVVIEYLTIASLGLVIVFSLVLRV